MGVAEESSTRVSLADAWASAQGLVFMGLRLSWPKRLGDAERNQKLAERWESSFTSWAARDRVFDLAALEDGYFVKLSDGSCDFRAESGIAVSHAVAHAEEVLAQLQERAADIRASADAQYLHPVQVSFEELVKHIEVCTLRSEFHKGLGAQVSDIAYLNDLNIGGQWFQLNLGPVRAFEIPRRVSAVSLKELPPVAVFCGVSTRIRFDGDNQVIRRLLDQLLKLGTGVAREVVP